MITQRFLELAISAHPVGRRVWSFKCTCGVHERRLVGRCATRVQVSQLLMSQIVAVNTAATATTFCCKPDIDTPTESRPMQGRCYTVIFIKTNGFST